MMSDENRNIENAFRVTPPNHSFHAIDIRRIELDILHRCPVKGIKPSDKEEIPPGRTGQLPKTPPVWVI